MTGQQIREEVEKVSKETGRSCIDVLSVMQSIAAKEKQSALLDALCQIKDDYINEQLSKNS